MKNKERKRDNKDKAIEKSNAGKIQMEQKRNEAQRKVKEER